RHPASARTMIFAILRLIVRPLLSGHLVSIAGSMAVPGRVLSGGVLPLPLVIIGIAVAALFLGTHASSLIVIGNGWHPHRAAAAAGLMLCSATCVSILSIRFSSSSVCSSRLAASERSKRCARLRAV